MLAGADRVEGTLMGNGERTGNMDIVTMAMNLYSQGSTPPEPGQMDEIIQTVKECTNCRCTRAIPMRGNWYSPPFPEATRTRSRSAWPTRGQPGPSEVAYLPIDPADIGRHTRKSSASTASPERAVWPMCWSAISAWRCRAGCRSIPAGPCRPLPRCMKRRWGPHELYEPFQQTYWRGRRWSWENTR